MKETYLNYHAEFCSSNNPKGSIYDKYCEMNPERFLFFLGNKFHLLTYHKCLHDFDKYDFKMQVIQKLIESKKIYTTYNMCRGVDVKKELKEFRLRNKSLKKTIEQVHYIYADNARKEYAITSKISFIESLYNADEIYTNYQIAKDWLLAQEYEWLLPKLDDLYLANVGWNSDEIEICKSIDHMVEIIQKQIKNN
jgi:hypothetical protein